MLYDLASWNYLRTDYSYIQNSSNFSHLPLKGLPACTTKPLGGPTFSPKIPATIKEDSEGPKS